MSGNDEKTQSGGKNRHTFFSPAAICEFFCFRICGLKHATGNYRVSLCVDIIKLSNSHIHGRDFEKRNAFVCCSVVLMT